MKKLSLSSLFNARMMATLFLGFASGFPYQLTGSTVQAWFTDAGIDIRTIGLLGLAGLPYSLKFLWAPLMDRYVPPLLGRRRGWILLMQCCLACCLIAMAFLTPQQHTMQLAALTFVFTFFAASQDITIDAYRVDVLRPEERGLASSLTIGGFRVAMIVSGALALILAQIVGWHITYCLMADVMILCVLITALSPEPEQQVQAPLSIKAAVIEPFLEFLKRDKALALLLLIAIYKLSNTFAASLGAPFLLRGLHFTKIEVGEYSKLFGFSASIFGSFVGGVVLTRVSMYRGLWYFGWLQGVSTLMFFALAVDGKNYGLMAGAVAAENFFDGLGTAAFLAFNIALCDKRYSATQYALFAALYALVRVFISPLAGIIEFHFGWSFYFMLSFLLSFPGLALVWYLRKHLQRY